MNLKFLALVFKSALLVGTLDILAACIQYYLKTGNGPVPVFKFIASGVFGPEAFSVGDAVILFGLLFHYSIAVSFTLLFFLLSFIFPIILKTKILTGIGFGTFVWMVMNLLVLPISNTPKGTFHWMDAGIGILILIVCIGFPLVFIAAKPRKEW